MAKKQRPPGKKYNFMDTYGDMMTLLMCFFVLLFAMSTIEETKYNAFVEGLTDRFGPAPTFLSQATSDNPDASDYYDGDPTGDTAQTDETLPADLSQLESAISEYIAENGLEGDISVEQGESGATFIRLSDNLLFDGDSSDLRPEITDFLDFFSEALVAVQDQILQVKFHGHTASIAGSGVDDWVLSAERAGVVSSYVNNEGGFSRFKIVLDGYGRNYPIADNGTDEGRAKNRRVDIIVLGNDGDNLEATLADAMRVYFPGDDTQFYEGEAGELPDDVVNNVDPLAGWEDALSGMSTEEVDALLNEMAASGAASG